MDILNVRSNETLLQHLEKTGLQIRSMGSVLGDYQVLAVEGGGDLEPPILITAGAHADELGGVYAALKLIERVKTEHKLVVLPVRDPFGFEGFRANLQYAVGAETQIDKSADVYMLLEQEGKILFRAESYCIAEIGEFIFAYDTGEDFPTSSVGRRLDDLVKSDEALKKSLASAQRIIAPWNLPMPRYGDPYQQAARGMIATEDGFIGNYNRFFDQKDPPPEVSYARDLVDELKPGLVLDLHEGYGRGFYVYKPKASQNELDEDIVSAMGRAVHAHGGQTATPEELQPYWGDQLGSDRQFFGNGVFYSGTSTLSSFGDYCQQFTHAFTLETGGLNPVSWRADLHVWASLAAINVWEKSQTRT